jgi:hypothetical protein
MRRINLFILILFLTLSGCKKSESPPLSGTTTIDNLLLNTKPDNTGAWYGYGFSVTQGKNVSTLENPPDVITIQADFDINYNVRKLYFSTNNFFYSFYRYGQYPDAATASLAFKNLTSFTDPPWTELADSVKANQIWLYKTTSFGYAKLRVISTVAEKRDNKPFASCTFEWVYQPDETLIFPGK